MIVGVVLQTAAQNFGMFIGCRFLIGFGLSFACLAAPILITELAFPTHRAPITSLYNSTWYLGSIVAAWVTYGTFRIQNNWAWRIPSALQGLPSILQILLIFVVCPESPRWLIDNGKEEQATAIIAKYHCGGDFEDPLVAFEVEEIKESIRIEREAKAGASYKQLFATKGNRRRMRIIIAIAFFSQWSGNGIVSYYLNIALKGIGITSQGSQTLFNGVLQLYNYATAIIGALVVDKAGRRTLFLTSGVGSE
jgi:MFS family permease